MYISQCLIAKNEEKNIERCLTHLKSVVDEQIVVDTGSTDRTVEFAERLGAKVFHFKWINDFSAARNFALDKSKGDWIIFLDCDEYFSDESVLLIRKCIEEKGEHKEIDGLTCELINIDSNNNILAIVKNVSPRIFKRKKNIRYWKKVHEVIQNINRTDLNPSLSDVSNELKIFHTGYDKDEVREKNKNERNITLLDIELKENPENSKLNLYLSKQYNMSGKYKEALEYANKALECVDNNIIFNYYCTIYSSIIFNMIALSMPYEDIKKIFDEAVSKYPDYPDYYMSMGKISLKYKKIQEAIDYFEKCIYYCNRYNQDVECVAIGKIVEIYDELLKAYIIMENKQKIVELSIALLNTNKYDLEILTVLIKTFLTQEKDENIIVFLNKIYDYSCLKDKIFLIKSSETVKSKELSNFYQSILNEEELKAFKKSRL